MPREPMDSYIILMTHLKKLRGNGCCVVGVARWRGIGRVACIAVYISVCWVICGAPGAYGDDESSSTNVAERATTAALQYIMLYIVDRPLAIHSEYKIAENERYTNNVSASLARAVADATIKGVPLAKYRTVYRPRILNGARVMYIYFIDPDAYPDWEEQYGALGGYPHRFSVTVDLKTFIIVSVDRNAM